MVDHVGRVEANVGGHKTDDRIEQRVAYDIGLGAEGGAVATLVVTRHHRGGPVGLQGISAAEDPARKANIVYERTFVPPGSVLLEARGFTAHADVPAPFIPESAQLVRTADPDLAALEEQESEQHGIMVGNESNMTTFGGWIMTQSNETTVTVLRYRLPWSVPRPSLIAQVLRYELLLTQQPGHLPVHTEMTLRAPDGIRVVWAGPETVVSESGAQRVQYAAIVDADATWGAVLAEE